MTVDKHTIYYHILEGIDALEKCLNPFQKKLQRTRLDMEKEIQIDEKMLRTLIKNLETFKDDIEICIDGFINDIEFLIEEKFEEENDE